MVKDIEERTTISPDLARIDFIVFSGDVARSGREDEYVEAKSEFFDRILEAVGGLSPSRLFIVPGNHDLDENEIEKLPDEFKKNAVSNEEVDRWLTDAAKREQLLRPFAEFGNFVASYTGQDTPDYSNVRTPRIDVSLLGINSAWWCRHHKDENGKPYDYGFLHVGEHQIHDSLEAIKDSKLRIAVLHHSQEWLEYSDGRRIWNRLRRECNFILHGHGHEPAVTQEHGTKGDCVIIPAGASFDRRVAKDPKKINSYNLVHIDLDTGSGTVFLRRWNYEITQWTRDDQTYPEGKFPFNLHGDAGEKRNGSGPSSAPHQIPPPPGDFMGRDEEIKILLNGFEGGANITGLRGMGGVGKTALALVLADRLKDSFPDGRLYLDMQGTSKNPLKPEEAMAHIIRSYRGLDVKLPADQNGLGGLYRTLLSGKRALILLDNAAGRAQVEPLSPPPDCTLLVTSRSKFALPGLTEKDLDVLPLEDAKKLLLEICGRIGEHAEKLAGLCGCLPLALRNAASVLREKPNMGVAGYIERLAGSRVRLDEVEASFDQSYQLLAPELQKLWCLLSVFPADFDLQGAAAVLDLENDAAEDALGELVKWSLVEFLPYPMGEGGRYRLHDLARVFSDSRLMVVARESAQQRHAKYYQEYLLKANELFLQGGDSISAGLDQFDTDWTNIQIGQEWAKVNTTKCLEIAEICSNFAWAGNILNLRLDPIINVEWQEAALVAVRKTKNLKAKCAHIGNLGIAYDARGDVHKAIEYFKRALKISRCIGDRQGEASGLGCLGNAYSHLSDMRKAIEYYEQALKIAREIGDYRGEGSGLGNLGSAYYHLGETRKAIDYHEQALIVSREIGDLLDEGKHLGNLGLAHYYLGEAHKAIEYYEQGLKIALEIGDMSGEGALLCNMGLAYSYFGETRKALEYYEQSLIISRKIGDRRVEANCLDSMGIAYSHQGETLKAIECHELALKISHEIGDRGGERCRLGNLGKAYSDLGEPRTAIEYYQQSLKIARKIGDRRGEGSSLVNLGNAYSDLGEPRTAIEYYQQSMRISQEVGDRQGEGGALYNQGLSYSDLGESRKAIEFYEQALKISRVIVDRRSEGNLLGNLGNAFSDQSEPKRAIEYYEQALKIAREIGDKQGEGNHLFNISISLYNLGQQDRAISLAQSALAIFEEIESPHAEEVRKALAQWTGTPVNEDT